MKFLNIVIYCDSKDNDDYQQMKQITSFYYKSFGENVKTLYVKYNENTETTSFLLVNTMTKPIVYQNHEMIL